MISKSKWTDQEGQLGYPEVQSAYIIGEAIVYGMFLIANAISPMSEMQKAELERNES